MPLNWNNGYAERGPAPRTVWLQPDLDDPNAPSNQGDPFKDGLMGGVYEEGAFIRPNRSLVGTTVNPNGGNLISSLTEDGTHRPVIDIDGGCVIVPSKAPGHCHLYIDQEMDWREYEQLLHILVRAGLVEPNYFYAAEDAKKTFVRLDPSKRPERKPVSV